MNEPRAGYVHSWCRFSECENECSGDEWILEVSVGDSAYGMNLSEPRSLVGKLTVLILDECCVEDGSCVGYVHSLWRSNRAEFCWEARRTG
jgi:NAD-dependent dihydropyrimidine dehydrogenase PreA subunit